MTYGYMGQILTIDLTTGSIVKEHLSSELKQKYLGGMGLGSRILWDEVRPGTNPLGPDNVLILATGPLTGTLVDGSARIDITTKSPLTNMFGSANAGGFWGPELKYAGYDAVIIRGKAAHPVYIWIENDNVELRSATDLWGRDTWDTTDLIRKDFLDSYPDRIPVMAIGPAGEKLVKFASITVDYHHSASRSGVGAVMGSKNLKAIAVRGDKGVRIAQHERLEQAVLEWLRKGNPIEERSKRWALRDHFLVTGDLPGKHFQTGVLPFWENVSSKAARGYITSVGHSCHCCRQGEGCIEVKTGKYSGLKVGDLHTWFYLGWGGLCAIDSLPAIWKCQELCERLGMDVGCASNVIAFAMELYQRGILSKKTADGLALEWGDDDIVVKLMHKIALREGIGDVLAEGSSGEARHIGKEVERYAVHIKGMAPYPVDPRLGSGLSGTAGIVGHLTGSRGDNIKGSHGSLRYERLPLIRPRETLSMSDEEFTQWFVERLDMPEEIKQQVYGLPPKLDPLSFAGKAALIMFLENERNATMHSLGLCQLLHLGATRVATLFSACTGRDLSRDDLLTIGERIQNLQWAYNASEGVRRKDMNWPERFYTEGIANGPNQGAVLSREMVNKTLDEYYELRGWDKEAGIPTRKKLEELDLKDVADELEQRGVINRRSEAPGQPPESQGDPRLTRGVRKAPGRVH